MATSPALVMVKPEMLTVFPVAMWNIVLAALPSTARTGEPGPPIVTFLFTSSSPLVSKMVPVTEKLIVSPSDAAASVLRSEPGPLSAVLETMSVAV